MSNEYKIMKLENRIALLSERTQKDNGRIVQKLKRQYRNLTGKNYAAPASEEN
jgi:hypothetical protein